MTSFIDAAREAKGGTRPLRSVPAQTTRRGGAGYAAAALAREADAVRAAPSGTRNDTLNRAAFNLGQLVAGGELDEQAVVRELTAAADAAGLDEGETRATIASGMGKGGMNPRTAPPETILRGVYQNRQQAEQSAQARPEPEPLEGAGPPPAPFPLDALPGVLGQYVAAVAAHTQTPPDMAAMTALGVLSVAAANRAWIHGGGGWIEPTTLWTVTVLPPASRKSAVTAAMAAPLYAIEKTARVRHDEINRGREDKLIIAEQRKAKILRQAGDADSKDRRDELAAELDAITTEIADLTPRPVPRLLVDDFTPEALSIALQNNGGHIGVVSAEGGVFGAVTGRYQNGVPQLDLVLKSYDGDPYRSDRVGRDHVAIDRPALALALSVQPDVLADTTKTPALRERGLMGRFAYSVPADTVGHREIDAPELPYLLVDQWQTLVQGVTNLPVAGESDERPTLRLDDDAVELMRGFRYELEPRLEKETGDLAFMADWAGKLAGRVLRVAALLHLAQRCAVNRAVSFETMRAAVDIGEYMLTHAVAVYGGWRAPETQLGPERVLRWIARTGTAEFTVKDAYEALRGQAWCARADDVRHALVVLAEHGWIVSVERAMSDGRRRLRDGTFVAHPRAIEGAP